MRKTLISITLAASLCAHAEMAPQNAPPAPLAPAEVTPACGVEGKNWDQLLQDFIAGWSGSQPDFCEFKRFLSLNEMISVDMRMNEAEYNQRMEQLYAYNDQSEPVNWLVMAFVDTWAGIFVNANLEKEFDHAQSWRSSTTWMMLSVVVVSLLVPNMKKFSTRPMRFLRILINDLFENEPAIYGSTSTLKAVSGLSLGQQPQLANHLVRPPLVSAGDATDQLTRNAFMRDFEDEMIAAGSGVLSGWLAAHGVSWGIGLVYPSWTIIFNRANISRTKFIDWAKPPVLAGLIATFVVSDLIAEGTAKHEFLDRVEKVRSDLMKLGDDVMANLSPRNELRMWQDMEKLKNILVLQNYLMTKNFMEDLGELVEKEKAATLQEFPDCQFSHETILEQHRIAFERRLVKLVKYYQRSLDGALDITQSAQLALSRRPDPMTVPLLSVIQQFSVRDRLLMDPEVMTDSIWRSVAGELKDEKVECVPYAILHPAVFP